MRRWTIAGTLGLIALLALGMAALRDSEGEWAEIAPTVAGGLILVATVLAVLRRGRSPVCVAFAIFGGAYFLAAWPIGSKPRTIPFASDAIERVVNEVDRLASPEPAIRDPAFSKVEYLKLPVSDRLALILRMSADGERARRWTQHHPKRLNFGRKIAHAWLSLAIGATAAFTATLLIGRPKRYDGEERNLSTEVASEPVGRGGIGDVHGDV